ncbi:MAG: hypothetical protein KC492_13075, partial [Myxococcales bacterium]|nr:hypothetical protein [Myxococcales bacterium]
MTRLIFAFVPVALASATLFCALDASADLLPPGHKGAKSSIQVSGEPPQDSVFVLANTFDGTTTLEPGKPSPVNWHPLQGD